MQVENQIMLLHGGEYGIKDLIIDDTGVGVGCDAGWISLKAINARFSSLLNFIWRN